MSTTIYMPMVGEGTDVWRPVQALELADGRYRIVDETPDDEQWLFGEGTIVSVDAGKRIVTQHQSDGR